MLEEEQLDQTAAEIAQAVVDTTRVFGGNPRFGKALAGVMAQVSADPSAD